MYLVDASGNQVAAYSYDPYGKVLTSRGVMAEINPLRYRGYYQDNETGFYYLQSRYYDPAICRFINADSYTSTGQGYLGYNAFAYCNNDPVNRTDADGEFFDIIFDVISIGFSIADVVQNPTDPWAWIGLAGDVIDVVVPFVSGVGETTKAVGAVADVADVMDDVHDVAKVADNVDDAYDAMKAADGINDTLGSVKDASKLDLDSACFIAGTLVLTADGYQNIEDVQVGDYVWAWDEETGDIALKQVVETYIREKADLVHIFAAGEEIVTTTEHPFYSPVQGWTAASDLRAGDVLLLVNGEYVVVEKVQHEQQECSVKVYNFQVEDFHTYYVGSHGVLVHNSCTSNGGFSKVENPLDNVTYTDKVLEQATLDDFHGFPESVDGFGGYGRQFQEIGGDGSIYTHLEIPGSYKGYDGVFEYIWDADNICNHRKFNRVMCKS